MWYKVIVFILLSCGLSWSLILIQLAGYMAGGSRKASMYYMSGPGLASLICIALFDSRRKVSTLGLEGGLNRWLLYSWLLAQAMCASSVLITWAAPCNGPRSIKDGLMALNEEEVGSGEDTEDEGRDEGSNGNMEERNFAAFNDLSEGGWKIVLYAAVIGCAFNTPLMLTEELGWRGYLWDCTFIRLGFWKANLIIGSFWGLWHAPIVAAGYNYPNMPVLGPVLFTAFCVLASPLYGYVRLRNGSVWAPCVMHGTINAMAGFTIAVVRKSSMPWRGFLGIGGFVAMSIADAILWLTL